MKAVPAGDNATLIELGEVSAEELHRAARELRAQPGVVEVIPGHSSLYVIRGVAGAARIEQAREPREHRLRVAFDGPDLPELLARVPRDEFLSRVATLRLTARYLGFRGGFAYLDGWPEEWAMPRRPTSRPVAAGSFAVAGNVAGFYPIDTPGGWNLLGRTDADVEDAFVPGDTVVLMATESAGLDARRRQARRPSLHSSRFELLASPLATVLGGRAPFDDVAAALALRAVRGDVELLECAMTGPRVRFDRDAVTAWCDPELHIHMQRVRAGEELAIGRISGGLRGYLAIGDEEGVIGNMERGDRHVIRAMRGPHDVGLRDVECEVTPQIDRVGIRLRPRTPLRVEIPADLRSIGMQTGTVQLHPDGSLVAMGPDHPVTGGYLQPMTVLTSERWKLAQLMPGERVTLVANQPPSW